MSVEFTTTKHIVLFGAGKSATVLIDYLKQLISEKNWQLTVADSNLQSVQQKLGAHKNAEAIAVDITNTEERKKYISRADIVISLMPAHLHYLIAVDCIELKKHLLTASYVDNDIKKHAGAIRQNHLLFLYEMGLDPGIDHMSAMQLIHSIQEQGGKITSFQSHCGGLVAPESDDNPWHYKISWNPRNVIMAGKAGAVYKENGETITLKYEELFSGKQGINVPGLGWYACYPNRDSLHYLSLYHLEEAASFVRTTLRHPDFCFGWKNIIDLKLTSEEKLYETNGLTVSAFFRQHFEQHGFGEWLTQLLSSRLEYAKNMMEQLMNLMQAEQEAISEGEKPDDDFMMIDEKGELTTLNVDEVKNKAAESVAVQMHEANLTLKQLFFLGLNDDTLINKGLCSAADVMQFVAESKLALQPGDKDMVVMLHEIEYEIEKRKSTVRSSLIVKGEDNIHTAMAKTVGLPLGIAAKLILEGKITETGLHIPVAPAFYKPVLEELKQHEVFFNEAKY
ncbi:saccharopine dehydrogenase C-terminal domain-containing protein [Parafilimonas sp.]|uniref:saccharopine dehydrogenase C-terminal domain-containing protein n=1 Tax=Parafilimonas sp. TaxID=1969739 RepID=UPI0039E3C2DA